VIDMQVVPAAGNDSMLLNVSGLHFPLFTRNAVILKHSGGYAGGGEWVRQTLEDAKSLLLGRSNSAYDDILNTIRGSFADRDARGRVLQNEEALTTEAIVWLAEAAHARYGFNDSS